MTAKLAKAYETNPVDAGGVLLGLVLGGAAVGGTWWYKTRKISHGPAIALSKIMLEAITNSTTGVLNGKLVPYHAPPKPVVGPGSLWADPTEPNYVKSLASLQAGMNGDPSLTEDLYGFGVSVPLRTDGVLDQATLDAVTAFYIG